MIILFLIPLLIILFIIIQVSKLKFDYWEKRGVPFEKPIPVFGNFADYILLKKNQALVTQAICKKHSKEPYFGVFYGTEPALVVQDVELLKLITTKDFYYFNSREISDYTHRETITQNLFFTQGDRWKVIRQNLTPLFSTVKMKNMFPLIEKCCIAFERMLDEESMMSKEVDIRTTMVRYAIDSITSCAFGIDSNVMGKGSSTNPFKVIADLLFALTNFRGFKVVARSIWPRIFYALQLKIFPTEVETFFNKLITGVFEARKYKPSGRNDFVDLILNLKEQKYLEGDKICNTDKRSDKKEKISLEVTDELLIAQCMVLFAGGFETAASSMSFTLFELAKHEEAKTRVFAEVDEYLKRTGGKVTFECMNELPYLDACISEAQRLIPALGVLTREVTADYELPSGLVLEKGLRIHLPVYHMHHNAEFFPDPEEFRPERFLVEQKKNIVPYSYMPFGEGPRVCIGMRFAKMQMAAGMVTLLKKYSPQLADGMPETVELDCRTFVTQARRPIRLTLTPRPGWEERVFKK